MALVRGTVGGRSDGRFIRGRVATGLFIPAALLVAYLSVWLQAPAVLLAIPALLVIALLFIRGAAPAAIEPGDSPSPADSEVTDSRD